MPMNAGVNTSNILKFPFKTLMSVNIETGTVSFNNPFISVNDIILFQDFLLYYGVHDINIRDAYGLPVKSFELLIGETTITLSHEAIVHCALALEQDNPESGRTVNTTRENISLILPTKNSYTTSGTSV